MDKSGHEWVSAIVDGEMDKKEIAELSADDASHAKWRNYHLIGDAMRNELPQSINLDLSSKIAAAIEQESPLNTINLQEKKTAKTSKVIPFVRHWGQYAIAASVALVAIVGVQNYRLSETTDLPPLPVLDTRPLVGNVSPVSLNTGPVQNFQKMDSNEQLSEQRRRLNVYIQDHLLQQRFNNSLEQNTRSNYQAH